MNVPSAQAKVGSRSESAEPAVITRRESEVRSYGRLWPATFATASGATITDSEGRTYLDFFSGAGTLNYGHNEPQLRDALIRYLSGDGILHSLDVATGAKVDFLETFEQLILQPRSLDYRVQFPGPTGTNAVEAALKLARKVTGRNNIACFTNAFHGMTTGALATTGSAAARSGAGQPLTGTVRLPFDGYLDDNGSGLELFERMLQDPSSGLDHPAAVLVETTQAEGGINVASTEWLIDIQSVCQRHEMLLIIDDIQVGCGRTGPFFSFERAGLRPDIICLSKSISGIGLPMALVLIAPEHDIWAPGEHNGTFRGNNAAFVTATTALRSYWSDDALTRAVERHHSTAVGALHDLQSSSADRFRDVRGIGLILGIECVRPEQARAIASAAFDLGLIIELAGARDQVIKLLPPLTISEDDLMRGLMLLAEASNAVSV